MSDWLSDLVSSALSDALDVAFDPVRHVFTSRRTGRPLPSVTQVMREQGFIDASFYSTEAAARGRFVHEASQLIDDDDFDFDACPAEYRGYCASYRDAVAGYRPRQALAEQVLVDHVLGFAGIVDRLWLLGDDITIVELKAGAPARWHGVQLAGYKRALLRGSRPPRTIKRAALYLSATGRPAVLKPFDDRRDDQYFLAAVTCCTYREEFLS